MPPLNNVLHECTNVIRTDLVSNGERAAGKSPFGINSISLLWSRMKER
jgi:hypothetical protein